MAKTEAQLPPTSPDEISIDRLRRARLGRRLALGLLALFVLLGAVGVFGIRTRTVSAAGNGYRLTLTYPATDRPQQPVRLTAVIAHDGGFAKPIEVGLTQEYLNLLDLNDIEPAPSASHNAGDLVIWEFDPPAGDTLVVTIDAIIEANARFGLPATLSVFDQGALAATVSFRTWVAP
ncbi:MAG TPA: hypothetical protein VKA30_08935 [Actinomycetota bacterium]|nr:hypothetical protein [Actinomycetota bacterium]